MCTHTYHPQCNGITMTNYNVLVNFKNFHWVCDHCNNENVFQELRELRDIRNQQAQMKVQMEQLIEKVKENEDKIKELTHSRSSVNNEDIAGIIREESDINRRRFNLCVFNLPDSGNDKDTFEKLCIEKLGMEGGNIRDKILETQRISLRISRENVQPNRDQRRNQTPNRPEILIVRLSSQSMIS